MQKDKKQNINYAIEKFQDLHITQKSIFTAISIFSVLFLCTGFLYNWYFLGYFGIDIQYYFSISDYISSSIGKIFIALSTVIAVFLLWMWDYFFPGNLGKGNTLKPKRNKFLQPFWLFYTIFLPFTIIASFYIKIIELFIFSLMLFIFLSASKIIIKYVMKFKHPIIKYYISGSIIFFLVNLFAQATLDIYYISSSNTNDLKKYEFTFNDESIIEHNDFILLSSNSQYLFFYDKKNELPIIIPTNKIKTIKYIGEKKYSSLSAILNYFRGLKKQDVQL